MATPDDGVLPVLDSNSLGGIEINAEHQATLLSRPIVRGMLPDTGQRGITGRAQLLDQRLLVLLILARLQRLALRVAGSHEGAALHPMGVLQREQLGARLANAKGEPGLAVHAVIRLAVGLDGSGRDGCSRHKKALM